MAGLDGGEMGGMPQAPEKKTIFQHGLDFLTGKKDDHTGGSLVAQQLRELQEINADGDQEIDYLKAIDVHLNGTFMGKLIGGLVKLVLLPVTLPLAIGKSISKSRKNKREANAKHRMLSDIHGIWGFTKQMRIDLIAIRKKLKGDSEMADTSDSSGGSFFGGLVAGMAPMVMAALAGIATAIVSALVALFTIVLPAIGTAILPALGAVLGVVFSPIGLAIAAAAALAWGLFTEGGRAFFASVGQSVLDGFSSAMALFTETFPETSQAIEEAWNGVAALFAEVANTAQAFWDDLKAKFDPVIKAAVTLFAWLKDKWGVLTGSIGEIFDGFASFLKDKFGIDIKAIAKTAAAKASQAWEAAKETGGEALASVEGEASHAKGFVLDAADSLGDYAGKTYRQMRFDEVGAALNFKGGGQVSGLNDIQTRALAANTAKTESGGKVDADNRQGYFGQYQFGAEALAESGLVKQDTLAAAKQASGGNWYKKRTSDGGMGGHEAFLRNPENWNNPGGLNQFLGDKALQDKAFITYTNKNLAGGKRSGALAGNEPAQRIAAYAKAAHLKGVGGANRLFKNGVSSTDGNGTETRDYANQAAKAMTGTVAAIEARLGKDAQPPAGPATAKPKEPPQSELGKPVLGTPPTRLVAEANLNPALRPTELPDSLMGFSLPKTELITAQAAASLMPAPLPAIKPPKIADAPEVRETLASNTVRQPPLTVNLPTPLVGQDVSSRSIAHIVTGGISRL